MSNRTDEFTEVLEVWLQEGRSQEDPERVLDRALARVDATPQSRFGWLSRVFAFTGGAARLTFSAATVVAVAVIGLALVSSRTWLGGPGPGTSPPPSQPSPTPSGPANILGLPPEGAVPSDPSLGQLVLRFASNDIPPGITMWVYADGRVIWSPFLSTPAGVGDAFTGLVEQRLTADGVAALLSQVGSTGLFEDDLVLARDSSGGFFEVDLRSGDRFVRVARYWGGLGVGAPRATDQQEAAIQSILDLFNDRSSWPASGWQDQALSAYVPSSYVVCFGVRPRDAAPGHWTGPVEPAEVWALLPEAAQDLLGAGEPVTDTGAMHADGGCTRVTTDAARALARSFEGSAVQRSRPQSRYFVGYVLSNPTPAWGEIWIQFGPVLPDGVATWLGGG
jgi:hypothetical protein